MRFLIGKLDCDGMGRRYQLSTQLNENLEAIYEVIFGEGRNELKGWLSTTEKNGFIKLLEELKNHSEEEKFRAFN